MRAILQRRFGGPEQLRLEEVPDPHPGRGQVRIRVASAGVHLLDTVVRRGEGRPRVPAVLPMIPGREVAGVLDETGDGVDPDLAGSRVVADLGLRSGGYAELAVAEAAAVHPVPASLDADAAVAMVGTGRTTMAILDLAVPTADDVVLVTAAAGGIGSLLVQAARMTGATVIGVVGRPAKVAIARDAGAQHAVDTGRPDWPREVRSALGERSVSLALDGVGGTVGRGALELLGVAGRLVMFGAASGSLTECSSADVFARGISVAAAVGARLTRRPGGIRPLERRALEAAGRGTLSPVVGHRFALADAGAAHAALESRATVGKVVLVP